MSIRGIVGVPVLLEAVFFADLVAIPFEIPAFYREETTKKHA